MLPLPDALDEARRLVAEAAQRGLSLRLLGGLAIRLHSPSAQHRSLARPYPDLDFAFTGGRAFQAEQMLEQAGYEPNKTFNLLNGASRLLFYDETHGRQVDIFVGKFHMSHSVPLTAQRLALEPLTLPLAELLLTKLQVVQMNEKDVRDICALLLDHPCGEGDAETINLPHTARLCADDWGLWKTVTLSLAKVRDFSRAYELDSGQQLTLVERLSVLQHALEAEPKPLKWKLRDLVGESVVWYELPEEVKRS